MLNCIKYGGTIMLCQNYQIEMVKVKETTPYHLRTISNNYQYDINATPFVCSNCGLLQLYITNKDFLNAINH